MRHASGYALNVPDTVPIACTVSGRCKAGTYERVVSPEGHRELALAGVVVHALGNGLGHLGHEARAAQDPDVGVGRVRRDGHERIGARKVDLPAERLRLSARACASSTTDLDVAQHARLDQLERSRL